MSNEIYALQGDDNNVMINNDGKVLVSDYDFKKNTILGFNAKIDLGFSQGQNVSFVFWVKKTSDSSPYILSFKDSLDADVCRLQSRLDASRVVLWLRDLLNQGGAQIVSINGSVLDYNLAVIKFSASEVELIIGNAAISKPVDTYSAIDYCQITGAQTPFFAVYNRHITESERLVIYNNGLGNELPNRDGLVFFGKMNEAEIINSDVVVRDFSGSENNAVLYNLPAGTLEEQRDYANANYFENFIQ